MSSGATDTPVAVAGFLQAPVIVSANGNGPVPEDHPPFPGGGWGADAFGREAFEKANVILAADTRFGPLPTLC